MSKPYSYDLRQKVIQAIKLDGLKISEASVLFSISRNTPPLMVEAASRNWGLSSLTWAGLPVMVIKSPTGKNFASSPKLMDKTQVEMASLWEGEISDHTISRALKKIGFTRKKRLMATVNGMRSNARPL